jgi:hypothetical protein
MLDQVLWILIMTDVNKHSLKAAATKPEESVAASFSLRVFDRGAVPCRGKDRSLKAAATKPEAPVGATFRSRDGETAKFSGYSLGANV